MRHNLFGSLLAAVSAIALTCAAPAAAQGLEQQDLSLPEQDLATSLRALSLRTGRSILAPAELVRGRRAPAISGMLDPEAAARLLLRGSGLDVRRVGESLIVYSPEAGEAFASGEGPATGESLVVVTGTHLRGAPPTSPTIVIGRGDIDRSGVTSVEQLMRRLPQNSQSGVNQETANAVRAGGDSTEHGAGLNLRGLGQRATLVLLDGRRLAPSSGGSYVDVSLIPLTAVQRVEVLTDGASAIYGSDAVGGVVNFILRDDFDGVESSLLLGSATRGDGDQLRLGLTGGTSWQGGHALVAYEYRLEDEIVAADRPFTINLRPGAFLLPRERRHSILALVEQQLSGRLAVDIVGTFARRDSQRTYFFVGSPQPVAQQAEAETINLSAGFRYQLSPGWEARVEGAFSESGGRQLTEQEGVGLVNSRFTVNRLEGVAVTADGPLLDLPAGPVRVAVGGEIRHEGYSDVNSTALVSNNVRRASRDIRSVYGEMLVPLFGPANAAPLLERLQVSVAGRYEDYRELATTFDPKLGLLWSPFEGVELRASYATSFRAPLLSETVGAYTAVYGPARLVYINPTEGQGVALVLGGANPDVRPERSRSWTFGGEIRPRAVPGLSVSLNHYSIRFSDRIAMPSRLVTVVGNPAFEPIVDRSPTAQQVADLIGGADIVIDISGPGFSNGNAMPGDVTVIVDNRINNTSVTNTSGVDLLMRYDFTIGANRIGLEANVNHILEFEDQLTVASPAVDIVNTPYSPLAWRGRAGINWSNGGWSGQVHASYANGYDDNRAAQLRRVGHDLTLDAGLAYIFRDDRSWLRGTRVAVHVENLFDSAPPLLLPDPGSTTGPGYDPVNASARGRFVSLQVRRTW